MMAKTSSGVPSTSQQVRNRYSRLDIVGPPSPLDSTHRRRPVYRTGASREGRGALDPGPRPPTMGRRVEVRRSRPVGPDRPGAGGIMPSPTMGENLVMRSGRTLEVWQYGDPAGHPVVFFHG